MMGSEGLKLATQVAILNANYIAYRLKNFFPILYKGIKGNVAIYTMMIEGELRN